MRRVLFALAALAIMAISATSARAYFFGGWPETCVEMNNMVEASQFGSGAVGIYERAFGDGAEAACQNDHRNDIQRAFAWAVSAAPTEWSMHELFRNNTSGVEYELEHTSGESPEIWARGKYFGDSYTFNCDLVDRYSTVRLLVESAKSRQRIWALSPRSEPPFAAVGKADQADPFIRACHLSETASVIFRAQR